MLLLFYEMDGKRKKSSQKRHDYIPEEVLKLMGKRIKELRIKKGYTSAEMFAYEYEIPRAQLGRYEKGQDLRMSSLVKLVNAFGITLEDFFSEGFE